MSVDDRLRRGLEANALSFLPDGEARLDDVHRLHRRRRGGLAASVAAAVVAGVLVVGSVLGGQGDRPPQPAPVPTETPRPSVAWTGEVVPDSTWRKVVVRDRARAAGADRSFLRANFGDAERTSTMLTFTGSVYSQSVRAPRGWAVGDAGTLAYDERGRLVLTSTSPGCRGCTTAITWRIEAGGERLRLSGMTGDVTPIDRLMFEGTWERQRS